MTTARVLHPELRVMLHKLVQRTTVDGDKPASQRFQQTKRSIDLTDMVSEFGTVTTAKGVRQAAGGFTIAFSDRPYGESSTLETVYGLVEPMDGIELRMSHNHGQQNRKPPIIMRGFVSAVERSQSVDGNGAPIRTVTIRGQDYGKIWQMIRIDYRPQNVLGNAFITQFPLFERFGIAVTANKTAKEFFTEVVEKIINPHLAGFLPQDWPMPRQITVEALTTKGLTSVSGPQQQEGSLYDILATFLDVRPGFNEIYIEDRPDGVVAVLRPNPALDLDGNFIQQPAGYQEVNAPSETAPPPPAPAPTPAAPEPTPPGAAADDTPITTLPETVVTASRISPPSPRPAPATGRVVAKRYTVPASDIISLELSRTDQDVANYFWVENPRYEMLEDFARAYGVANTAARASVYMETYPNNRPSIYGIRPMVVATQMGDSTNFSTGADRAGTDRNITQSMLWADDRRAVLAAMNKDNVMLETGQVRMAGNENIRAGMHLNLGAGALAAPYYAATVIQEYQPFKGYFTTVQLERGQGFVRRIQAGGQTPPFILELGAGAPPQNTGRGAAAPDGNSAQPSTSIGQTGAPGTPDSGNTQATERGPAPSTAGNGAEE